MIVKVRKIASTEAQEMSRIMGWANYHPKLKHPVFGNILVHVPNEGKRSIIGNSVLFGRGGGKVGFPDLFLPIPKTAHSIFVDELNNRIEINHLIHAGMFIELKRINGGTVSINQHAWIGYLNSPGYYAVICRGADKAIEEIERYLG